MSIPGLCQQTGRCLACASRLVDVWLVSADWMSVPEHVPSPPLLTTAGEALSVTCTATVVEFLVTTPILQWLNSEGSVIPTAGNPAAAGSAEVSGKESTLGLMFSPLRVLADYI